METKIIWFTGLSGAGKSTLGKLLYKYLKNKNIKKIKIIDGDIFRKKNKVNSFTRKNIIHNNFKIINYIQSIKNKYNIIIISVISPILKTRKFAHKTFKENYFEIFVKCSINKLVKRDTKGLYKLASKNKIKNLIGYNSKIKYEPSLHKKLIINTGIINKQKSLGKIIKYVNYF
jgi:adenylylsulfate kinase